MTRDAYSIGAHNALSILGMEKRAVWSTVMSGLSRLAPLALSRTIQRGATRGAISAARHLGASRATQRTVGGAARQAVRYLPRELASQTLAGGTLTGGLNALMAEEGQRGQAFAKGFGEGALTGLAVAPFSAGLLGLRHSSLRRLAKAQRAANPAQHINPRTGRSLSTSELAERQLNRNPLKVIKDMFGPNRPGTLGRSGAALDAIGMTGQFGTELMAPAVTMGSLGLSDPPAEPNTPSFRTRTAADDSDTSKKIPAQYLGSVLGSGGGYALGGIPLGILRERGHLKTPAGVVARAIIPAALGLGGGLAGYTIGSALDEPTDVNTHLDEADIDRLVKAYSEQTTGK